MTKFNSHNDEINKQGTIKAFSMKKKIIVNTLLGFLALFLAIGLLASFYLIKWLNKEFDQNISAKSRILVTLVNASDTGIDFEFADEFMPEFGIGKNPEYFQLWQNDNNTLAKSKSIRLLSQDINLPVTDFRSRSETFNNVKLPDGRNGRMVRVSFFPQIADEFQRTEPLIDQLPVITLAVAKERESLDKTIRDFLFTFIGIVILFTIIAALTIWQMVTKGLQPLKNMQRKMSVLAVDNLSERLKLPSTPKELEDTIDQFNLMLDRLENSFEREKRFTSEVAHELRAPISEMRNLAETAIKDEKGWSPYQDILNSTMQMQITVSNLMALARCEKGNIILEPQVIKLAKKMDACWLRHTDIASKRSIDHINNIGKEFKIMSSPAELDIIFNNLISNAITYSEKGTEISTFCKTENDILCICVTNKPQNLRAEDLDKMFDRMWQKDHSSNLQGNTGLGLALVKSYSDLLGLKIETNLSDQGLLTINLCGFYQDH